MNIIGENSIINTCDVSNKSTGIVNSAKVESQASLDNTAAILSLSEESFGDGVVTVKSSATREISYTSIVTAQNYLRTLGFYNGSNSGYVSNDMRDSIRNFQKVYGMAETASLTDNVYNKIVEVYNKFNSIYSSNALNSIANNTQFQLDAIEKKNFALIWTFLDKSMGITGEQIVGVMANIRAESGFSSDNLQGNESDHDTNYIYNASDGKGYGILQWTYRPRKEGLQDMASAMELSESDINAQLAYFRKEMTTSFNGLNYVDHWDNLKETTDYIEVCDLFMEKIESPKVLNYTERRNFANIIYNNMNLGGFVY